jgi:hypothetical protein
MSFLKNLIYVTQEDLGLHAPSHRYHCPPTSQRCRPIIHQQCTCRNVFTTPRVVDHSTLTTGFHAPLRLLAIHLLLCRSVRSSAVFFGSRRSLVFVFVVFLQLCFGCKFTALLWLCIPLFCLCCNFCIFSFILLSVLFYLPAMTWFDLVVEIVLWVLASTSLHAPLRLLAIHLLFCQSVRSSVVFFGSRRSLVFVFVVFL